MKLLRRSLALTIAGLSFFAPRAVAADSALDSAFVTQISPGFTPTSYPTFDNGTGAVNAVALQSDGKILAGGNVSRYQTSGDLSALKRLLPTGALDTSFNSGGAGLAATSGEPEVNTLLRVAGDKVYVGGTFTSYNGTARSGVLRLNSDGTLDNAFTATGLGGTVRYALALAEQPDGKLLVGGGFSTVNGNFRPNLARLQADGTLDTAFNSSTSLSNSSFIGDIAVLPNGQIVVAGGRIRSGGGGTPLLARLNSDGTLDPSLAPAFADEFGDIDELLVLPDGRILIGGDFTFANGESHYFACLLPDGSLDTAYMANLGSGPNGWVGGEIVLQPDGTVLVGGIFSSWNGQARASVARLNFDGTLEPTLAPAPYAPHGTYGTHFYSFAVQPDGKLLAGGWFSRVSDPAVETYNLTRFVNEFSATSPGAIRLLAPTASVAENASSITLQVSRFGGTSGAVSVQFATSTGGSAGTAAAGSDYTTTTGTLSWAAGDGGFKTITVPVLQDTAAESAETFTVTLSNPTGGATLPAASIKTVVTLRDDDSAPSLVRQPASVSVEQGGRFVLSVAYDSVLPSTLRWQRDPDGAGPQPFADVTDGASFSGVTTPFLLVTAADPALHAGAYRVVLTNTAGATASTSATVSVSVPAGSVVTTTSPIVWNRDLLGLALESSDRPLVLTAGLSGSDPAQLRRLVRSTDATPLINIEPNFNTATFTQVSGSLTSSGSPTSLLVLPDGKILVGGFFTHVSGAARPTLARLTSEGLLDSAYTPSLPTVNLGSTITSVVLAPGAGGKFYAGFDTNGGLRRYAADGTLDTGFAPNTNATFFGSTSTNNAVTAILEAADGKVYVAHRFSTGGFGAAFQYLIWRLNPDGTRDTSFVSPTPNFTVTSLALLPDGRLAFAGLFQSVNSLPLARLAIANPDGTLDAGFFRNPNFLTGINKLFYRDGRLLVVGEYQNTLATPRAIARYNLDGTLDSTFAVGDGANGRITGAAFTSSGELLVVGGFSQIKGVARNRLAYLVMNPQVGAIGFAPSRVIETERSAPLTLTLRRYGPVTEPVSVRWTTADGLSSDTTATAGQDYTSSSGTVAWAAGDNADKTVSFALLNDSVLEPAERFRVVLSQATGPITLAAEATVELIDDDTPPTFTTQPIAPATLLSGGSLSLSGAVTSPTAVAYQWLLNGVAIPGATSASYAKNPVSTADAGLYTLVATNAAGAFSSNSVLVVIQPLAGRIAPGQTASGRPVFNANPQSVVALPDGGALIGGAFSNVNSSGINYLVRVKSDGSLDSSLNLALNNAVTSLLRQPDGKVLAYGTFTSVNGVSQRYLLRLNTDLTPDTAFNSAVGVTIGASFGNPTDLAVDSTGRIYIAFNNFSSGGTVLRLTSAGSLDSAYGIFTNLGVLALAVQPSDDKLVVAGNFTSVTGFGQSATSKNRLARFNPDGTLDAAFSPAVGTYSFQDLLVTDTGRIFGSGTTPSVFEANPDGSATVFGLVTGNQAYEMALGPDGRLALARASSGGSGSLSRINLPSSVGVGSATNDTTFNVGSGPNADVTSLAYAGDGSLWIAGVFTAFDGFASGGVAKLQGSAGNPGIVNPPVRSDVNAGATARLSVGAVGTGLTYRWLKNGAPLSDGGRISGATTAVLSISGVQASDDDFYTVEVTGGSPLNTVVSTPVKINLLGAPVVVASPAGSSPMPGSTITLAADVLAATPATYRWTRDGVPLIDGGRYSGTSSATLVISSANAADAGAYTLTVTNTLGSVSTSPATLSFNGSPTALASGYSGLGTGGTTNGIYAILHLPDGRSLVASDSGMNGTGSTSVSSGLAVVSSTGAVSVPASGAFNGSVQTLLRQPDGKILVAGGFTTIAGTGGNGRVRIARLNADLTLDTTFTPAQPSGTVFRLALDSLGRIYVQGSFFNFNGLTGYSSLVRLESDGSLDLSYNPSIGGTLFAMRMTAQDRLLIGGSQLSVNNDGVFTAGPFGLMRLLPDGGFDSTFSASLPGNPSVQAVDLDTSGRIYASVNSGTTGFTNIYRLESDGAASAGFSQTENINNFVQTLRVLPGGKVLVGGDFTAPAIRVFRLNADGSRDNGFDVGTGPAVTSGTAPSIRVIAPDSFGRLWVGGTRFSSFNGTTASRLAILDGDGLGFSLLSQPGLQTRDLGGTATFTVTAGGNNGFTYRWRKGGVPLSDSARISGTATATLTITGLLSTDAGAYDVVVTSPSGPSTFANLTSDPAPLVVLGAPEILAQPVSLTRDIGGSATFTARAQGAATLAYQWLFEGAPLSDGTSGGVNIAGSSTPTLTLSGLAFARAGAYRLRVSNGLGSATSDIARLTLERRPGALAAGTAGLTSANSQVYAILRLQDGSMLVGGSFTTIVVNGAAQTRNRIARFLADGSLDTAFNPSFNGDVRALAQDSSGRVFVGGNFTSVTFGTTTTSRTRVARLTSALVLDPGFDTSAAGPNNQINALAPTNDGGVYVGGVFGFNVVGTSSVNRIARLSATGALDTGFTAAASINNEVKALLRRSDGKLYAGGTFGTALLNTSGSVDTAFVPAAPSILAVQGQALLQLSSGDLVLGANAALPQPYLRRLNPNTGASLTDFATGHSTQITALALQPDGKVISGAIGSFKRSNPVTGEDDTGFAAFDSTISAIAVDGSGRIWVGGSFTTYNGVSQARLAVLNGGDYESRDGLLTPQTLTFPAIADRTFGQGGSTVTLSATSSVGLTPVTFRVTSGPATVSGTTLTITGAGTITVEAAQAGDATYAAATATRTFAVAKAAQTITFDALANKTIASPAFTLAATASSGLPVSFSVSSVPAGIATLSGNTLTLSGATGTVTVTATQAGNTDFNAATSVSRSFEVTAGTAQTITFNALASRVATAAPFTVSATANSGLPVSFSVVSGPATISGNTVTLSGTAGTVTIRATQSGGDRNSITYAPAAPVDQSFEVTLGPPTQNQTITFAQPAALTYGADPLELTATASSGLPVSFELVSTVPAGIATLEDGVLTVLGAGRITVRAVQPGAFPFKAAAAITRTVTVNKAPLAVSFESVSRLVRQPNPAFTPVYSGFVNGDEQADLASTRPTGRTTATASSPAGQYPITLSGGLDANYTFVAGAPAFLTVEGFGGAYEAFLVDELGSPLGKLELLVPANALTYTGVLNLAAEPASIAIRGTLAATDGASAASTWVRTTNGVAALSLSLTIEGDVLTADLERNGEAFLSAVSGSRLFTQPTVAGKKQPAPWIGAHTLVLRNPLPLDESDARALPLGAGHASASVAATGVMTLTGKLADGTTLTTTAKADADGVYRIFARPYAKRLQSVVAGELPLESHPDQTRFRNRFFVGAGDSTLIWTKAALPSTGTQDKAYRAGFEARVQAVLDPWIAPSTRVATVNGVSIPAGTLVQRLGLADLATASASVATTFVLEDESALGARAEFLPATLNLSAAGAFTVPLPLPIAANNPAFTLKVTPATGAFTGSFTLSDLPAGSTRAVVRKVTVSGILRQGPESETATLGHAHFLLDPVVGDTSTEQVSGELQLSPAN